MTKNIIGARKLPFLAKLIAKAAQTARQTPQNKESPIPAKGPIRLVLTALIESALKSGSLLFSFSIEAAIPITKVDIGTVVLK